MVYNPQDYCGSGMYPASGIANIRKHNVSETGSISVLRSRNVHIYMGYPIIEISSF
jgi:hypothetical protein